jgi:predicted dehydrogenase
MHAEYTIRGLEAKKHVLCEKPMAVTVKESEEMIAAAKKAERKLMIAYRLRYEPLNMKVIEMCQKQEFGKIQTISASNCQVVQAPNIRLSKKLGGGPLGDIGVYCINAARYITREEPEEVTAWSYQPKDIPRFREVPASVGFTLRFPSGAIATCDCSFNAAESRKYRVHCSDGFIDMDPAFSYRNLELRTFDGKRTAEFQLPPKNHFASEMEHFSHCILEDQAPRTPGEEGLADMRVMAAIEKAAETGRAVKV